ncbi:MAG: DUF488 domain-containing protein [Methanobrevibacter sp. CfCl-M3]
MEIHTIGHSTHEIEYFIELLQKHEIDQVLDVRSTPYSKHAPQFNKKQLKKELEANEICYKFVGDSFGARQEDPKLYSEDGILDFNKVMKSQKFRNTFNKVMDNINRANFVLMCSEKDPLNCHRSILISNAFSKENVKVNHILSGGEVETQIDFENRLLDLYNYRRKPQETLDFHFNKNNNEIDYVKKAYEKRNKDIGYSITSK